MSVEDVSKERAQEIRNQAYYEHKMNQMAEELEKAKQEVAGLGQMVRQYQDKVKSLNSVIEYLEGKLAYYND